MSSNNHFSKLTDVQRSILSSAAGRADRLVIPVKPASSSHAKTMAALLRRGLLTEVPVRPNRPHWRKDKKGKPIGAKITADGMAALRANTAVPGEAVAVKAKGKPTAANEADVDHPAAIALVGKPGTKQALIIGLLRQDGGATLNDLIEATGWLPHTTRAALSGLRRKGLVLEKIKNAAGKSTYRIASGAAARQAA